MTTDREANKRLKRVKKTKKPKIRKQVWDIDPQRSCVTLVHTAPAGYRVKSVNRSLNKATVTYEKI